MILADGLLPFLLHLIWYMRKDIKLLLVHLLLSIPGNKPQDNAKKNLSFSQFYRHIVSCCMQKINWTMVRQG